MTGNHLSMTKRILLNNGAAGNESTTGRPPFPGDRPMDRTSEPAPVTIDRGPKPINKNWTDEGGFHAGGQSTGVGFTIAWQRGPCPLLEDGSCPDRNGAFLEEVLEAVEQQLQYFQRSKFNCAENERALDHLGQAIAHLTARHGRRRDQGILGRNELDPTAVEPPAA